MQEVLQTTCAFTTNWLSWVEFAFIAISELCSSVRWIYRAVMSVQRRRCIELSTTTLRQERLNDMPPLTTCTNVAIIHFQLEIEISFCVNIMFHYKSFNELYHVVRVLWGPFRTVWHFRATLDVPSRHVNNSYVTAIQRVITLLANLARVYNHVTLHYAILSVCPSMCPSSTPGWFKMSKYVSRCTIERCF